MLSPVSTALAFEALPAAYRMMGPTSVAGGVQSNWNVRPAPTAVVLEPAQVCSRYCKTGLALQGTSSVLARAQRICVFALIGARIPARVLGLLASRAVSWNPHLRCAGSLTVTLMRCFTPGAYDAPPASIVTLPPPAL